MKAGGATRTGSETGVETTTGAAGTEGAWVIHAATPPATMAPNVSMPICHAFIAIYADVKLVK